MHFKAQKKLHVSGGYPDGHISEPLGVSSSDDGRAAWLGGKLHNHIMTMWSGVQVSYYD